MLVLLFLSIFIKRQKNIKKVKKNKISLLNFQNIIGKLSIKVVIKHVAIKG